MTTVEPMSATFSNLSADPNSLRQYQTYEVILYQAVSGFLGLANFYILVALTAYELFLAKKRPGGKKLRVLCILTVLSSVLYSIVEELIIQFSNQSEPACYGIMVTRMTVQNAAFSFNYAVMWLRQYKLYSTRKFRDLVDKKVTIITWIILVLIVINPFIMLSSQFTTVVYHIEKNVCLVRKVQLKHLLPFLFVVFNYGLVQMTLVFLFFYPLYKRRVFHKAFRNKKNSDTHHFQRSQSSFSAHTIISIESEQSRSRTSSLMSCDILATAPKRRLSKNSINRRLLKWLKLSIVSILVDWVTVVAIVVFLFVYTPSPFITTLMLWLDVGVFVSSLCIIGYFEDFSTMMYPFAKIFSLVCRSKTLTIGTVGTN